MDQEIASLYDAAGAEKVRPRFVGPLLKLDRHGPMTIRELADRIEVTHSAMSQTVAGMRRAGLIEDAQTTDRRTRRIALSQRGRELLPLMQAEWRATEAAIREIEAEIPYPLTRAVEDVQAALSRRPFSERLRDNLARALDGRLR